MRITTSSRLMRVMSTCNGQRSDSCRGDGHSGITARIPRAGGSVAEWLASWTQAHKGPGPNRSRDAVGSQS